MKKGAMAVGLILVLLLITLAGAEPVRKQVYYNKKVSLGIGTKPVRFSLWDVATGGTVDPNRVWFEEKPIAGSNVKTYLGDVNPLDGVDFSQQLWLQIEKKHNDDTYTVVGPRERFSPEAYALWSGTADVAITAVTSESVNELADNSVSSSKIQAGAVTGDKIAYDAVTGSKINSSTTINVAGVNSSGPITANGPITSTGPITGPNVTSGADPGHTHTGSPGVPSGFFILGATPTPPAGYSYTGVTVNSYSVWTIKKPMPTPRSYLAVAAVNGKIYAIGGCEGPSCRSVKNEEYDPATNSWTTKADMPTGRSK